VNKAILQLKGITKTYGEARILRRVELEVQEGEFLTLLGPSGSGKSTLLRMVAGFVLPDQGQIRLDDRDVSYVPPGERQIGMVFQNYALFPHLTAAENIGYGLKVHGWTRDRREARVREMLALVGLHDLGRRLPRQLSGGQQQRVALARALAFGPRLLLMDEPLGALDRELRIQMAGELRRLHRDVGATFLYVTHDRDEAMSLSDRVAIIRNGSIESIGAPASLFAQPPTAFVASFFAGHNVVPVRLVQAHADATATVNCEGRDLRVATGLARVSGEQANLVIPRAAIALSAKAAEAVRIEVEVLERLYLGDVVEFTGLAPGLGRLVGNLDAQSLGETIDVGTKVPVYLDPARCIAVAFQDA